MMKAFSFLTILESLSKKLSILRTKMHSDDLRVNHESITSQLRVNPLFSHCASSGASLSASSGASFDLSRRASHFAAILTILFTIGVGSVSAQEYYTPTSDEVIILNEVYSNSSNGYSNHSAIKWEGTFSFNNKTAGDPNNNGAQTASNVKCCNVKGNGGGKNMTISITGCSQIIIYHENNPSRYVELRNGSKTGDLIGNGSKSTYYTTVNLAPGTQYPIFLHGTDGSKDQDFYVYAIKLIKSASSGGGDATTPVTGVSLNKTSTTLEIGGTETLTATIEPNNATNKNVAWSSSNTSVATVDANGLVTAVAAGTATITVTTEDGNKTATCAVTVNAASGGGSGDDSYMYFVAEVDATTNGVINSQKFTGVLAGGKAEGSFSFNGKEYIVTRRTSNTKHTITFEMPDGWTNAILVLVHSQSSRNFTLEHPDKSKETEETKENGDFYENTFTITQSGTYTISNSENIGLIFIGLINNSSASTPTYSVTYDANGATSGSVPTDDDDYESGATVTVKSNTGSLAKTGYTFDGWNTKADGTGINYTAGTGTFTISANTTLYAKWNVNSYTITLNVNGGTINAGNVTSYTYGEGATLPTNVTKDGYTFEGWYESADFQGDAITTISSTATGNKTYWAKWTVNSYTVSFNLQGHGSAIDAQTINYGAKATQPTTPTATGYTFGGWYKETGCTNAWNFETDVVTANITLYAQWECTAPEFNIKITNDNPVVFSGESIELTVVGSNIAANATYQWYKGTDVIAGQITDKLIIANATANDAGNYKCVVTNGTCSAENDYTVKMYHIKGLKDVNWTTPFEFEKNGDVGTFSVELEASTTYYFKLNDGSVWYWNEGTMTHNNCTGWVIEQEGADTQGKANTGITTTASGIYTFTLNYTDPSKPTLSVTYPQKKMVYFNPNMWDVDGTTEVYTVYSWQEGSNGSFVTMTSVEGCGNTNIYQAEIDASHNKLLFIRWNQAHTAWDNNRWNQSIDLDYQTNGQYKIDDFENNSELYWKEGAKKSWASHEKTFTPNYTVTFDANSHGTAPADQCIAEGGKATQPTALTATGYTFGGWYKEAGCTNAWDFANDVVTSNITLYAKWTANSYTVTWNPAGGNWGGNTDNIVQTYEYGAKIIAPEKPSRTGFEFVEWAPTYVANETTMPANDVTYTAQWREIAQTYTITYDINRPTKYDNAEAETDFPAETTVTVNAGGTITLPNPNIKIAKITVYTAKWKDASDNEYSGGAEITPTGDMTLTAQWTPQSWPIRYYESFDGTNLGTEITGLTPNQYTYGVETEFCDDKEAIVQNANKTGYTWLGWWSRWSPPDAPAITTATAGYSGEFSLFAKWEANAPAGTLYTVTFNTNGGSAVSPITQTSEGAAITLPTPTRDGYTFAGWYIGGTLVTTNTYTPTADITATAAWKAECTATGGGSEDNTTHSTIFTTEDQVDGILWSGSELTLTQFEDETPALKLKNEKTLTYSFPTVVQLRSVKVVMAFASGDPNLSWSLTAKDNNGNEIKSSTQSTKMNKKNVQETFNIPLEATNVKTVVLNNSSGKQMNVGEITFTIVMSGSGSGECYYVTYNGNGATSGYVNDPTAYNSTNNTVTVKENGFTKTGYTFNGWNTAANGSGTSYAAGATFTINSDTELFAQWTSSTPAQTYTITYNCDGATSGCPANAQATNLPNPLLSNITKTNYVFEGWYTDAEKTTAAVAGAALTANTILYAKWADMDIINEDVCWNISDDAFKDLGTIATRTEVNNLHIVGASNENITVDAGNKTIAGTSFTHRLKYGGKGNPFARHLWFSVMGNCNITIYMMSANNTQTRHLDIATGTFDNVVQTFDASPTPSKNTYNYTGGPTTIYLYPNDNGLNIYQICVKYVLPPCTTPILSDLENKKVCPGEAVSWTAIVNNTATLQENGETIAYQWNKKGNNTVLSNTATLTLDNVTEATGGTYVVTATVSAEGKASKTASKEVTLTVTPATATPTITASASTVYAGNPVTLKATCVSSEVTYQWYKCTDAEGNGESAIGDAENATLALTAGEAGTYYYKVIVTGDDTHSCGTAEKVYTLIVSAAIDASDCTTYFWFPYAEDATTNKVTNNENKFFGNSPKTGSSNSSTYNFELDDKTYTATKNTGSAQFTISFTVPENSIGTMAINCKGSSSKPLYLRHTDDTQILVSDNSSDKNFVIENITPGTWTLQSSGNWALSGMAVKVCSGSDCTDPQVTATVDNATVCEGAENVTFTATNYADGAAFQWQKKDGNTWTNINGATSDTYTISSVTTAHAGQYRVIAETEAGCKRISEEVTLTVLTAPTFNTFADEASVMKGNALAISDVQATNATGYAWYKSTDNSLDVAADTKVGTSKDLLLAAASIPEAADQTFYLFCVASNSCGSVTSDAITVTVTPFIAEECATKGNETNDREFGFKNTGCGQDTYGDSKTPVWKTSSRSKYLTYTAPEGRYFATAKVTVAHTGGTKCGYAYSTDGGTTWEVEELDGLSTTLTAITIELPANVNAFRISRNLTAQDGEKGSDTGIFYLAEACFTYENACTETTLTAGSYNNEYNISTQMDFVEPTFTLKAGETTLEGQTLTYTSSNTAIATVDEDGNVTFEGMTGTVTITATFAGGEINETEYCACQGSYTITVGCKDQAPKIVAAAGTNLNGCNNSITLEAKMQNGTAFADGTFQWYRDGEAIEGATSASYEVVRAGTYTVSRTHTCTTMSSNSAVVTNDNVEPKVERLTPFQYYHVDKTYSNQMKGRHLFAVTSYGTLDGKRYHLTATRNGETLNLSSSTAFFTIPSSDNAVDTVMIDLNELTNKYAEGDEIVITCAPINNCNTASAITASITIHVIGEKPTLALICSGANGEGTRDTKELVVGGDFLTGYNKADLCQQTGNTTFDPNTEWGFYTELKKNYIVVPVNGYAQFNKLNYEPFDILLLTDYPKSSKDEAAQKIIDDMAELCDYRPLLSFKTHFQSDKWKDANGQYKYTKWVKKGFTTAPVVPAQTATYMNIVCYAHPMFDDIDEGDTSEHSNYTFHDADDPNQLVYQMLTAGGYESVEGVKKGIQGFELAAADNFVTIGLIHNAATAAIAEHDGHTHVKWTIGENDRQLVALAERQTNIEARMMLFSLNAGAQSMQTDGGRVVILKCLEYLLQTDPLQVADCRFTFDNGEGAQGSEEKWENGEKPHDYQGTGYQGDGLWSTAANWGPDYNVVPGRNTDVRIAAPCIVDAVKTKVLVGDEEQFADAYFPEVLSIHITKDGSLTIPANSSLTARSTILRADEDGNVYPTNVEDISLGSNAGGNASLILNNERGDTKAGVAMYSTAKADTEGYSAAASTWQYIGTPHSDVQNAANNYYDSWLYQYDTGTQGWAVIPNGGPLVPFRGYCVTHPENPHTYWMEGTLVSTTNQDITIPANRFVVVANSWTAPIQIGSLEDDDMEGLTDKTIYFFNTGKDPDQEGQLNQENGRYAAGTYVSVPIHSAPYTGDSYIPSMQGFYVVGSSTTDGTLHLDYERHVRAPRTNTPSGPMHAPARRVAADDEPQVAKFLFRGTRYDDRLIILERPDFTRGYDSGWDGEQWGGNAAAPMSYVVTETRWDAVSAIPEYEGTVIAFRAGEDSEYTIHFDYDGMEDALYLLDTDTQIYTRVLKGNSYTFTCTDKAEHNRFILTRKAPQIATGTDHINTGENAKAVKFIKDDKIFIFVNGTLYDATGKMVIR
ncbi:MAG: InlB B-repeat-containing protein [Paludibacteraceae bacterium]|nr:InlB B-repeat-containing protein [Paludibacteraceae bacterium]